MTPGLKQEFDAYMQQLNRDKNDIPVDFKGNKRLTAKLALLEIEAIRGSVSLDLEQQELLAGLEIYLKNKWG
jgi:hypothetical protein